MTTTRRPDAHSITRRILFAMSLHAPITRGDIARITGLTNMQVKVSIGVMRRRYGSDEIYVRDWQGNEAMYGIGPGIDVDRPSGAGRSDRIWKDDYPRVVIKPYEGMVGAPAHPFDGLLKGKQS